MHDIEHGEAKDLAKVPSETSRDVKSSIIRTTITNERLLEKKMETKRIKKFNRKKTSNLKRKADRSEKVDGILAAKIAQSISRAKYIQHLRKSAWDQINKEIEVNNLLIDEDQNEEKSERDLEKEAEDRYVQSFFEDNDDSVKKLVSSERNKNIFAILDEALA